MAFPEPISEYPARPVRRPAMFQGWEHISFLHWRYAADVIRQLLPQGLEPDTFDGSAWVGLTPFLLTGLRAPGTPALPWISRFPEMNVRTYVIGPDGKRGIWFFLLEAARLHAVVGARISYRLPYRWAAMKVSEKAGCLEYSSRRHFGHGFASIVIHPGAEIASGEQERFLTARFRLYTVIAGRLSFADVEHEPWLLQECEVLKCRQDVIAHSGLPAPQGDPLGHHSRGVHVRIGTPSFVRT